VNVLVVGGGGREHALCRAFAARDRVFCAPGNAGTAEVATNLPISADDAPGLLGAARSRRIDLTVIGPEAPLAAGLADAFELAGRPVFGPAATAARLEASKAFAKAVMDEAGVPTAAFRSFTRPEPALAYIAAHAEPLVVKASGLAAGKGAVVCATRREAAEAAQSMFEGRFGAAGQEVVVEACLTGEELSVFALTDGEQVVLLPSAQDHKRLGEGDTGPNTGGMGAYTPVSLATPALLDRVEREILRPTLEAMVRRGAPYRGILYAGLMIAPDGAPSVIEFNCRLGDPETQVVLPVAGDEFVTHCWSIASREAWRPTARRLNPRSAAVTTVLAAPGYPERPVKGAAITLPERVPDDAMLFHAGTTRDSDGVLRTSGGRVLCATGLGATVADAARASRRLADAVEFEGKVVRRDIGWREIARAGAA
jgi:phosphoribosylamine--glycine ligase